MNHNHAQVACTNEHICGPRGSAISHSSTDEHAALILSSCVTLVNIFTFLGLCFLVHEIMNLPWMTSKITLGCKIL